ncbi:hypothetical protein LSH36_180g01062 [Paralvinella palmiformis]|uniref:receptor protein-tyrosine kinase n=1 Tax=Paralvinella palmiformis TaxID=53620 RepID=A0AAD9N8F4_9ANNE|nr:hypothetical protein LSH36_180g01062 [Paralvinella palmiformis]
MFLIVKLFFSSSVCPLGCGRSSCYPRVNERNQEVKECCHSECLGGCRGPRDTDCIACVHIFYEGRCVQRCPPQTYEYHKRRCITEAECRNVRINGKPGKLLDDSRCVEECPSGYIQNSIDESLCEKCEGPCPKVCHGLFVDSVSAAQQIKGCTVIKGILEIQIRGGSQIGAELEENLGSIEEITHYLKIIRSYAILSLRFLKKLRIIHEHVGKELEANLGEIEEVTEYVSINKAHALTNLRFLKNLRLIHGDKLFKDRHALVVIDNENLQDIWDFSTHPNLTIKKGHVFFHYNRRLCLHLIDKLVELSGINGTDSSDVNRDTNGDLIPCHTEELKLEVVSHLPTYAIVRWTNFFLNDHRELLSWVINLREAPFQNVTMYDSRDACGTDEWKQEDVKPDPDKNARWIAHIIYKLKPFTQYAVYVQTFTVARAAMGAMSPIVYFTTDPDVPWPARDIEVTAEHPGELRVEWKPPLKPNGNVTHYYVYWQPQSLDRKKLDQRNYCINKLRLPGNKGETIVDQKDANTNATLNGECCACPKSEAEQVQEEEERLFQIKFEDYLHDSVYIKRPMPDENRTIHEATKGELPGPIPSGETKSRQSRRVPSRQRRSSPSLPGGSMMSHFAGSNSTYSELFKNYSLISNMTNISHMEEKDEEQDPYEVAIVYSKTEVILPNLKHFQEYSIEVIACHNYVEGLKFKRCSNRAITTHRTQPDLSADNLDERNITATNGSKPGEVIIRWQDPSSPNGLIVTYELELSRVDTPNYKPFTHCITHKDYWKTAGYHLNNLHPGNWSYRIRATSLAGNGSWTSPLYFFISEIGPPPVMLHWKVIAGISTCATVVIVLIVGMSIWYVTKKRFNSTPNDILYASVNPEYWSAADVYVPDEWEVSRDKIELIRELGQGSFGMVYEGLAREIVPEKSVCKVAIKTVNEKATMRDRIEFLNEASVMKVFDCNHVVKLRGVVSKGQPTLVVMELMANGDLKSFLRSLRPDSENPNENFRPPTLKEILQMAGEIADGMSYLAAKKFVHRDLAARNCMVSEDLVVKIGDFGMTREIYETDYYRKGGKGLLPVRWMSPESLKDGIFTSQSDVWSYGVVIWEMATLAAQPYQGLSNEQVLHFVIDGGIMEKPEGCPDKLYNIMQLCWKHNPKDRSTFSEIIEILVPDLNPNFRKASYFFSDEKAMAEQGAAGATYVDESWTPLTSSQHLSKVGSSNHMDRLDADNVDDDEEVDLGNDIISTHSTLSYSSHTSAGHVSGRCEHIQPCGDCVVTVHERWPTYQAANSKQVLSGDGKAEPNPGDRLWDERNCQSPGGPGVASNEGSKGSSKSNDSSHSGINGFVNGHVPHCIVSPNC